MRIPSKISLAALLAITFAAHPCPVFADQGSVPPGYTLDRTGHLHDFDYFRGGWTTHQHKLLNRDAGGTQWEDFDGNLCMSLYLDGLATVDELYFPSKKSAGLTLRTFDIRKKQWDIYWVSSTDGRLGLPPMQGGFQGDRGEFYAADHDSKGRPIKVRFLWILKDQDHARWEQAFSWDDKTWVTNWTADFTRADTAKVCRDGKPIH